MKSPRLSESSDNAAIAELFSKVWLSADLSMVTTSVTSTMGAVLVGLLTFFIRSHMLTLQPTAREILVASLQAPLPACLPIIGLMMLRSRFMQSRLTDLALEHGIKCMSQHCDKSNPENVCFVVSADEAAGIVGFVVLHGCAVEWLVVDAAHRRQGVGSALMKAAEEHCAAQLDAGGTRRYSKMELICQHPMPRPFFPAVGYVETQLNWVPGCLFGDINVSFSKEI